MNMSIDSEQESKPRNYYGWTSIGLKQSTKHELDKIVTKDMTYDQWLSLMILVYTNLTNHNKVRLLPKELNVFDNWNYVLVDGNTILESIKSRS